MACSNTEFDSIILDEKFSVENLDGIKTFYIPTEHIIAEGRKAKKYIQRISFVCPLNEPCRAHQFLNLFDEFWNVMIRFVEDYSSFPKMFLFQKDKFQIYFPKLFAFNCQPCQIKDLSHLRYSKRLQFLN